MPLGRFRKNISDEEVKAKLEAAYTRMTTYYSEDSIKAFEKQIDSITGIKTDDLSAAFEALKSQIGVQMGLKGNFEEAQAEVARLTGELATAKQNSDADKKEIAKIQTVFDF